MSRPAILPYGNNAYEVVYEGRQVGLFRARYSSAFSKEKGRHVEDVKPADLDEAKGMAELFCRALGET